MAVKKTHVGTLITKDGPKLKRLHATEKMWVVGTNELYHKETGRRHFAEKHPPSAASRINSPNSGG